MSPLGGAKAAIFGAPGYAGNLWSIGFYSPDGETQVVRYDVLTGKIDKFLPQPGPNEASTGVTIASDGNVWVADNIDDIYEIDPDTGAVISSITPPDAAPRGITFNSGGDLWVAGRNSDTIYRVNPSDGTVLSSFSFTNPNGIDLDADGNMWVVEEVEDVIYKVDPADGTVLSSFDAPDAAAKGVAVDPFGRLWVVGDTNDRVYRMATNGAVLRSFPAPVSNITGAHFQEAGA